ncbi:site-2 protease family protein [Candidatus Woesearchaeota archaeon]|nr:site-2 protease family protein [Candidatus Woesearchaeota archaeon]
MDIISLVNANIDYFFLVLFGLVLTIFLLSNKKKVEVQKVVYYFIYMIMYRTKWGLKKMDSIAAKLKKHKNALSYTSITIGFIGMALMTFLFLLSVYRYFFVKKEAVVAPLLPGATIPGLPHLSFIHWILAIFILATVHEMCHGIFARMHGIKIKSSGFAIFGIILPIIPAAFVEQDEKDMEKKSKKAQLAVLSAGTFANFITAGVFFLILALLVSPLTANLMQEQGVVIAGVNEGGPAELAGIKAGEIVTEINGFEVTKLDDLTNVLNLTEPYEKITLVTENGTYYLTLMEHPDGKDYGYMGVSLGVKADYNPELVEKYGLFQLKTLVWFSILIYWIFLTNLMVGLVNLLPMGIVDGGLMFYIALNHFIKDKKKAKIIFSLVSVVLLLLLLFFMIPALLGYFAAPFAGLFK